jgi:hypothetical protein
MKEKTYNNNSTNRFEYRLGINLLKPTLYFSIDKNEEKKKKYNTKAIF